MHRSGKALPNWGNTALQAAAHKASHALTRTEPHHAISLLASWQYNLFWFTKVTLKTTTSLFHHTHPLLGRASQGLSLCAASDLQQTPPAEQSGQKRLPWLVKAQPIMFAMLSHLPPPSLSPSGCLEDTCTFADSTPVLCTIIFLEKQDPSHNLSALKIITPFMKHICQRQAINTQRNPDTGPALTHKKQPPSHFHPEFSL